MDIGLCFLEIPEYDFLKLVGEIVKNMEKEHKVLS